MGFDASNIYSRVHDWVADRVAGIKIRADRMDAEFDAVATALTDLGQNNLDATSPYKSVAGTVSAPGVTFVGDLDTGIYSPGADQIALAAGGVVQFAASTSGVDINSGAIDGTVIGGTTPAAGTFTTADINGGEIDGTIIGGVTPAAATVTTLRATSGGGVTLASTTHAFQTGPDSSANIAIDTNEIQARNNGAASSLFLNNKGGTVFMPLADIDGGNIDGTIIGATSPEAGTFTSIGIGTSSPSVEFHMVASTPQLRLQPTSDAQSCRFEFTNAAGNLLSAIRSGGVLGDEIELDGDVTVISGHSFVTDAADINGGNIDGTVIGAGTAAAGTFTVMQAASGSVGVPSISFSTDPDTGFYRSGVGNIGVSLEGAIEARFQAGLTNSTAETVQTREKADARYLSDARLGTERTTTVTRPAGVAGALVIDAPDGSAITSVSIEKDSSGEIIELVVKDRPVQQLIGGAWATVGVV